jgi:hypothetical protein
MFVSSVPVSAAIERRLSRSTWLETTIGPMVACRLLGHRYRFTADGAVMRWACARCGEGGEKRYESAEDAARYATAFDREDRDAVGRRTPLGLLPLVLLRRLRRRR